MTKFFQRLMGSGGRPATETGQPRLTLGAFGKHPGWNDHIPGIGVETEALAHLKQAIYVTGIGGRIDSGAWKALGAEKRIEGFDHNFLCLRGGHVITGRMFSSADGLRRKEYPMVLCVDTEGVSAGFILPQAQSELDRLREACQATASAEQVTTECRWAQDRLRGILAASSPPTSAIPLSAEARLQFLDHRDLGPDRIGLLRVLHELGPAGDAARTSGPGAIGRSCHLRLPLAADSRNGSLLLWADFFRCAASASSPLLLMARAGVEWLDVIIGEPTSDDFFCLQASPTALPLASTIPYELTPELKPRLQELAARFLRVESLPLVATQGTAGPGVGPPLIVAPGVEKLPPRKGIGLGLFMVIGGVGLAGGLGVWLFSGNKGSPPEARPPAVVSNSVPAKGAAVTTEQPAQRGKAEKAQTAEKSKLEENAKAEAQAKEANRLQAEAEAKRLAEDKKAADAKAIGQSDPKIEVAEKVGNEAAAPTEAKVAEDEKAQARARESDADLAQIALAQGNYERAMELCQKWPGVERFQPLLKMAAAETNQLRQVKEFLQAGNYNPILTNRLPENSKFKEIWTTADGEKKILDQASAEFAGGDYPFLQRPEVQALQAKPPFQKLLQDGGAEAGQLMKAKQFQTANQPQAAKDFIAQVKLQKPPFVKIQKWATVELERIAREQGDSQTAKSLFEKAEYSGALALCQKYSGLAAFDTLARSINEEQKVLADTGKQFSDGDYSFIKELEGREYKTKPPFAGLLRKGGEEQAALGEMERLKQAGDWQALQGKLDGLPPVVSGKKPFEDLRQWAQARVDEQADARKKDPVWLDAKLEILLVRLGILRPTDPRIKTPAARQEKALDGALNLAGSESYLNEVNALESEYKKGGWLDQGDRKKLIKDLRERIKYGN